MPGINLLTSKDLEYRINKANSKIAIGTDTHVLAIEKIMNNCPSLEHLILVRGAGMDD